MSMSWIVTWMLALLFACPFFAVMGDSAVDISNEGPTMDGGSGGEIIMQNGEAEIEGVVIDHVFDCAFDGHCYVVVESAAGIVFNVTYAPGMMRCENPNLGPEISELVAGDRVEAYGEIIEENWILVCNSEDYYLNKIEE